MLGSPVMNSITGQVLKRLNRKPIMDFPGPIKLEREMTTAPEPPAAPTKKRTKKKKRTGDTKRTKTAWDLHVQAFRAENTSLSFKEVLQKAKETYNKEN